MTSSNMTDWAPALTPDSLTLIFGSDRAGGAGKLDLYVATRNAIREQFGTAQPLGMSFNDAVTQAVPAFTHHGLSLYYWHETGGSYRADRASTGDTFGAPVPAPEMASNYGATFSIDGDEAFWGYPTISHAFYDATSASYGTGTTVMEFNLANWMAGYPTLSGDGLTIYFTVSVAGTTMEIYQASRPTRSDPFDSPTQVVELAGHGDDPEVSFDGRTLVFASNRQPSQGMDDLWMSTRSCL